MKYKVNEWQELSIHKDIRKISKTLSENQSVKFAIGFDLCIATIAIIIDKCLTNNTNVPPLHSKIIFWALLGISILPFLIVGVRRICKYIEKKNTTYTSHSIPELIDIFDNDICYYVMMADSFNQMLTDTTQLNTATFYYIETWYYINKAKYQLYSMLYKTKNIFSDNTELVMKNNLISISRLINIANIIEDIRLSSNGHPLFSEIITRNSSVLSTNTAYDKYYKDFISEINQNFNSIITINFEEEKRFS